MGSDTDHVRSSLRQLAERPHARQLRLRLEQISSVIRAMDTTLDPDQLFPVAVEQIVATFQAERGFLILGRDPDRLRFEATATFDRKSVERPEEEVSHAVIRQVAAGDEPVLVRNALADERFANVSSVLHLQLYSVMCAPLVAEGELIGVVYLDNRVLPDVFDESDLSLLMLFAGHAAIAIRNAQLFEELTQAKAALVQSERLKAVGQLAASVVHQIKNPLAAMKIIVDEAPDRFHEAEFRQAYTEILDNEFRRLNAIVDGLLEYSRPAQLIREEANIQDVLDGALALFQVAAADAGVALDRQYASTVPRIRVDREKLQDVFYNLLNNALDAVAESEARRITVSTARRGEGYAVARISDTGPGMSDNTLDKLFEPFVTTKRGGTGLGLVISAKIVAEHGGTIHAENRSAGGAEFTVVIPAATRHDHGQGT